MDFNMTDADISLALREESYLDHIGRGALSHHRDLVPLLKVLRYKALHSKVVCGTAEEPKRVIIRPSHWLR